MHEPAMELHDEARTAHPARTHRRSRPMRALAQGTLAVLALIGGISMAELGDVDDTRPVAERLASREVAVTAFNRAPVEPTATQLATRYQERGYAVSPELAGTIATAAKRHGIALEVAFGLVSRESSFRNHATSHVGAVGLSQLMPRTARWLKPGTTVKALRDPATNVDLGFGYLATLIDKYRGDVSLALLAYNRGPGTVDRILRRGGNPDNGYAREVLALGGLVPRG